jgi:hypothetical protein
MKMNTNIKLITTGAMCALFVVSHLNAQEPYKPRVDLSYIQEDNEVRYVKALVRKKLDKRFEPLSGIAIEFLVEWDDDSRSIGTISTDTKGEAKMLLRDESWPRDPSPVIVTVLVSNTDSTRSVSESLEIIPSTMHVTAVEEDNERYIRVQVKSWTEDGWQPVEGAEMKVLIKRTFGHINVADELYTTDDNGEVELTFLDTVPGDEEGNITILSTIEDHDELGTLAATAQVKWGVPRRGQGELTKRTLWAPRDLAPWWLLVFPNAMIAAVWGVIIYLAFQLRRISRLGKNL